MSLVPKKVLSSSIELKPTKLESAPEYQFQFSKIICLSFSQFSSVNSRPKVFSAPMDPSKVNQIYHSRREMISH